MFTPGKGPSPLAQDENFRKTRLNNALFVECLNWDIKVFTLEWYLSDFFSLPQHTCPLLVQ